MGTKQSSLANKKNNENGSTLTSAEVPGKRGREVTPKNINNDLVIVNSPTSETLDCELDCDLDTHRTNETEESDYDSEDDELDQEFEEFRQERTLVLQDAQSLKRLAMDFNHPEAPVQSSPECYGRNYFSRPSAFEQESVEDAEERAAILADAAALKKIAMQYAHPEAPVQSSPECYGRNYFSRPSAFEQESVEDADERAAILADAAALKKTAMQYAHPEAPVQSSPECYGRNYFSRPSVPGQNTDHVQSQKQITGSTARVHKIEIPAVPQKIVKVAPAMGADDEGDLPRSASSVQLFGLNFHDTQAF